VGPRHAERVEYLRVAIRDLRRKLEADPAHPRYILTVPRIGYRLETDSHPGITEQPAKDGPVKQPIST